MKKIGILVKKEMTEILRDKKTLIIMIVMPLLLYPALLIGLSLGMSMLMESQEEAYTVGYLQEDEAYITPLISLYQREQEELDTELIFKGVKTEESHTAKEESDVWVDFSEEQQSIRIQVNYTSTNQSSNSTEDILQDLAEEYREELLLQNLEQEGLTEDFLYPVIYEAKDSVSTAESMGMSIGGSIGMLLITTI